MSTDWVKDIYSMHEHYEMRHKFHELPEKKLQDLLNFRVGFIQEEVNELIAASSKKDPEDVVDALIDVCVVAIGTLDAFNVDAYAAWDRVLEANMKKQPGAKHTRPNPLGFPDLIKPDGWRAPDHSDNVGRLSFLDDDR